MNLLFLNSIPVGIYGGMEHWICSVASGLSQRGHITHVIGRYDSEFLRHCGKQSGNIRLHPTRLSGDFDPFAINRIRKIISDHAIDAVIVNFNRDIRLGGIASCWAGNPPVIWSAGLDIVGKGFAHKMLTYRLISGVITPSQALKRQIASHGVLSSDLIEVIPIGIDDNDDDLNSVDHRRILRQRYQLADDAIIAVTSGRFVEQKGHRFLIDAAPSIVKQFPKLRFLFLGNGELESSLREQISAIGMEDYFVFAGLLDSFESELLGSDLMIHPSIEEPFGIVLVEGMRASLPIVASKVGGIPEVVVDSKNAVLVESKDSVELSKAVVSLLFDTRSSIEMGQAGRKRWQEMYRLETMIDRVESYLFSKCIRKRADGCTQVN